ARRVRLRCKAQRLSEQSASVRCGRPRQRREHGQSPICRPRTCLLGLSRQIPGGDAPLSRPAGAEQPVWDVPVRLIHWLLAALIGFSWWSVKNHHTDWHIWSGCAILTLL